MVDSRDEKRAALQDMFGTDASHVTDSTADRLIIAEADELASKFTD